MSQDWIQRHLTNSKERGYVSGVEKNGPKIIFAQKESNFIKLNTIQLKKVILIFQTSSLILMIAKWKEPQKSLKMKKEVGVLWLNFRAFKRMNPSKFEG